VRNLGSEPSAAATSAQTATIGNAKGVDLLQGYVAVKEGPVKVALGRQKMQLGAGRFLSTLEWSPTSRAFDGVAGNWSEGPGDLTAFYFLVRDTSATVVNDHLALMGLNYDRKLNDDLTADAAVFYDQSELRNAYGGSLLKNYDLVYLDERLQGKFGLLAFEEEFIWQAGGGRDTTGRKLTSAAFQGALRAGVALPRIKASLGLDVMSGDSKPGDAKTTTYRANYYFAHAYFGWMDYFVSNPAYGVMDYRADADALLWQKEGRSASLKAQYHYFTPQDAPSGADDPYGQEIDAELHLGLYPKSDLVLGAAAFLGDKSASRLPAAKLAAGQKDQTGWFLYFMPVFDF
jgi:hypothetical protein